MYHDNNSVYEFSNYLRAKDIWGFKYISNYEWESSDKLVKLKGYKEDWLKISITNKYSNIEEIFRFNLLTLHERDVTDILKWVMYIKDFNITEYKPYYLLYNNINVSHILDILERQARKGFQDDYYHHTEDTIRYQNHFQASVFRLFGLDDIMAYNEENDLYTLVDLYNCNIMKNEGGIHIAPIQGQCIIRVRAIDDEIRTDLLFEENGRYQMRPVILTSRSIPKHWDLDYTLTIDFINYLIKSQIEYEEQ